MTIDVNAKGLSASGHFTLQILHASDQEAGVTALVDALGLSAVMQALNGDYENTLRLTSGDTFIAGPFSNASQDPAVYANGIPGIADILIQNRLGWHAAAIGNHEFGFGTAGFADLISARAGVVGAGINATYGYPGALFPYLAANIDFSGDSRFAAFEVAGGNAPQANSVTSSVVVDVNGTNVGVLSVVTPYLADIANIGNLAVTTRGPNGEEITNRTPDEVQAAQLVPQVAAEVAKLEAQGIKHIVLMTHLQEAAIEQALAQQLADAGVNVDVLIGGGSHQVMANDLDTLRQDETQQNSGLLLQPYPQEYSGEVSSVLYVNTGANYRYLSRLTVTFDEDGNIIATGDDSDTYATDLAGVQRLYGDHVTADDLASLADPEIAEIVDGVGELIRSFDSVIFGQSGVFLNGQRDFVRTEETNLGNLVQDANRWYVQQYIDVVAHFVPTLAVTSIDVSFGNGGGIRDFIGTSRLGPGETGLIQGPTEANPEVGKEEGDISQLDISNSLRFDNDLIAGTVTAAGLVELVEHGVSATMLEDGGLAQAGQFGQWSGLTFSFDARLNAGERVVELAILNDDGSVRDQVVSGGEIIGDLGRMFGIATATFLANGGDSYPGELIENRISIEELGQIFDPVTLGQADLRAGRQQDALAEYLSAFYNSDNGQAPYDLADTAAAYDQRIVQIALQQTSFDYTPIYELQGASHVSPIVLQHAGFDRAIDLFAFIRDVRAIVPEEGQTVSVPLPGESGQTVGQWAGGGFSLQGPWVTTRGIITSVANDGFYLQDAEGDGRLSTSDAIFVFTGTGNNRPGDLEAGHEIRVQGRLEERFSGNIDTRNAPTTQLNINFSTNPDLENNPEFEVLSRGNALPESVLIGEGGRLLPTRNLDDDAFAVFNPTTSGLDFWESLEGMLVTAQDLVTITGLDRFNEVWAVTDQGAHATGLSERGGLALSEGDHNPERIQIQLTADQGREAPAIKTGDKLGDITGVVSYAFGHYEILPTMADPLANYIDGGLQPTVTTLAPDEGKLTVATYNVLNLDPNDNDVDTDFADFRFLAVARDIVFNMKSPDVIALQEVQDNSGTWNDGITSAGETLQTLINAIDFLDDFQINGSSGYAYIDNPFVQDNLNGGQPNGNIRTAYLYNANRVDFVEESLATVGGQEVGEPFRSGRSPLVADFIFEGETITLVNNHWSSKSGSAALSGIEQAFDARLEDGNVNNGVESRRSQAAAVAEFVVGTLEENPDAHVIVLGDMNEFSFVSPLRAMEAAGLTNLDTLLAPEDRYTFVFSGNSQKIDHILVSDSLLPTARTEIIHTNVEFLEDRFRASDHDAVLALFDIGKESGATWTAPSNSLGDIEALFFPGRGGEELATGVYIDALYANVLHREADEEGRLFWVNQIDEAGASRANVAFAFALSDEAQANLSLVAQAADQWSDFA